MNFGLDTIENGQCRVLHLHDRRIDLENHLFHGIVHHFDNVGDRSTHPSSRFKLYHVPKSPINRPRMTSTQRSSMPQSLLFLSLFPLLSRSPLSNSSSTGRQAFLSLLLLLLLFLHRATRRQKHVLLIGHRIAAAARPLCYGHLAFARRIFLERYSPSTSLNTWR